MLKVYWHLKTALWSWSWNFKCHRMCDFWSFQFQLCQKTKQANDVRIYFRRRREMWSFQIYLKDSMMKNLFLRMLRNGWKMCWGNHIPDQDHILDLDPTLDLDHTPAQGPIQDQNQDHTHTTDITHTHHSARLHTRMELWSRTTHAHISRTSPWHVILGLRNSPRGM